MMKAVRKWVNFAYTLYALIVFAIPVPFVLLFHGLIGWMNVYDRLRLVYKSHRVWISLWEWMVGVRFEVEGMEHIARDQSYVFVVNHNNMLDILIVGSHIIHPWKSLVKKEIRKIPFVGFLISLIAIPVDRSSKESRKQSLLDMVQDLKRGISILVFPEGTRNRTGEVLRSFYPGAFITAIKAQVPIIPIVIYNHRDLQPVNKLSLHPGNGNMLILPPVPTEGLKDSDMEALKKKIHQQMYEVILARDKKFADKITQKSNSSDTG